MNWATIAPSSRIYKGKNIFRWEVSPGLEHHCGTCATPLRNTRAKTSCLGKHVEPCYRFHQQLHFVGKSHECFGCNASDELHHTRHVNILRIMRQITALDQANMMLQTGFPSPAIKSRRSSISSNGANTDSASLFSESTENEGRKQTRRERKKAKKASNGMLKDKYAFEVVAKEEADFVSEAIHLSIHESKGAWEGTYVYDHRKPEDNDASDAADEQIDNDDEELDIAAHLDSLAVRHPKTPRQRRIAKRNDVAESYKDFNTGSRRFSPSTTARTDMYDGVDPQVFFRLGIEVVNPPKNSKARKDLVAKLVAAVKEDLIIIEKEENESAMREEGFWRWAGKGAYNAIMEVRKEVDWATGMKKGPGESLVLANDEIVDDGPGVLVTPDKELFPEPASENEFPCQKTEASIKTKSPLLNKTNNKVLGEDDFMTVVRKKGPAKKAVPSKNMKPMKSWKQHVRAPSTVQEEEGAEDEDEMVRRYSQRKSGERNVGKWSEPTMPIQTPIRKATGGILSLRINN